MAENFNTALTINLPKNSKSTGKSLSEAFLFAEHGENLLCTEIVFDIQNNFCTQHVLPMLCKKKSFRQRFTCTRSILGFKDFKVLGICNFVCNKLCYVPHPNNYKSRP